jgi:predicted nucleic acid-binding protein
MEAIVDTNVLIYEFIEDSELHSETIKLLDKLEKWIIPTVVIEEFIFALKALGVKDDLIAKKVEEILTSENIEIKPITEEEIKNAISLLIEEKSSFKKFNDKLVLTLAKKNKTRILTFDKDLRKECKEHSIELIL